MKKQTQKIWGSYSKKKNLRQLLKNSKFRIVTKKKIKKIRIVSKKPKSDSDSSLEVSETAPDKHPSRMVWVYLSLPQRLDKPSRSRQALQSVGVNRCHLCVTLTGFMVASRESKQVSVPLLTPQIPEFGAATKIVKVSAILSADLNSCGSFHGIK